MFRHLLLAALSSACLSLLPGAASFAAPTPADGPQISIALGDKLLDKAETYGRRELAGLMDDLRKDLAANLSSAAPERRPRRLELVIEDAVPNRPTFAEMGKEPGLSMRSIRIGGARISGQVVDAVGESHPITFSYYESDIREERGAATWTDANRAFDYLARDLASGKYPNR